MISYLPNIIFIMVAYKQCVGKNITFDKAVDDFASLIKIESVDKERFTNYLRGLVMSILSGLDINSEYDVIYTFRGSNRNVINAILRIYDNDDAYNQLAAFHFSGGKMKTLPSDIDKTLFSMDMLISLLIEKTSVSVSQLDIPRIGKYAQRWGNMLYKPGMSNVQFIASL